jgi:hypothetical protein
VYTPEDGVVMDVLGLMCGQAKIVYEQSKSVAQILLS